jgi:ribosomal protein S18
MYYKNRKRNKEVSKVYQSEDRNERFDYDKTRIDILSGIIGYREKIRDSR